MPEPNTRPLDNYARIRAVRASTLGKREKAILSAWLSFANAEGIAYPSVLKLAEAAGYRESATRKALRVLEREGWLVLIGSRKGGRLSNTYRFSMPNPAAGGGLSPVERGPQPDAVKRPTRQTVPPSPPAHGPDQSIQQTKEKTTQHTAAADALLAMGIGKDWLTHPNATPERLVWLVREAKGKQSPAGFAVAAIRDAYPVPAPDAAREKAIDDAVRKSFDPFDGLDERDRAKWIAHARCRYRNLASESSHPDDSPQIRGAVIRLMRAGDAPQPKRALGVD